MYFKDKRLELSYLGAFIVRVVVNVAYIVLVFVTLFLLMSDVLRWRYLGAIIAIFLIDRLLHYGDAEKSISEAMAEKFNLALVLTPKAYRLLDYGFRKSLATHSDFYFELMRLLAEERDIRDAFARLGLNEKEFTEGIEKNLKPVAEEPNKEKFFLVAEKLMLEAYKIALKTKEKFIEPRSLFTALANVEDRGVGKFFELFAISVVDLQEAIIFGRFRKKLAGISRMPAVLGGFAHRPRFLRHRIMNRAWTARPTPTLDQFSSDLTDLARAEKVGLLIGHAREFETMLNIISRPGKPNALLVGSPGAGKSTMIAHLAFRMIKDDVPPTLFDKRLVSLEVGDLIANASPEILAGRLNKIVEEIILAGNIILFIPNIHDLFRTGEVKAINAIDILLPIIKSEAIPLIGETYPREFKQYIESRSDFLDQFETIKVEEINEEEALRFLIYSSLLLEKQYKIVITFMAVKKAVSLAHRYFRNKMLPGSALDLLKEALMEADRMKLKILKEDTVAQIAEERSKIPIQEAGKAETEKLLRLEEIIHKKLVNQEAAVRAVSRSLREYRSGLARKGGPIATFLFVGPTGVGKTELAKILAEVQFGSKETMRRFDMSEYQDKQSIFRFIGTPDGEKSGTLTDAILEAPYSLILLDEFEKAYPDILNLFLQVFDDGRLTDGMNRTVDFQNTIIIATSNAHSEFIKSEIENGKKSEDIAEDLKKKLTDYFKPELINRFSDVMVFRSLNMAEIKKVTGFVLGELVQTLRETHGIDFTISDEALGRIAEMGYDPVFGARPLRQVVSDNIKSVLAEKILKKEIERGDALELILENGEFVFRNGEL